MTRKKICVSYANSRFEVFKSKIPIATNAYNMIQSKN